MAKYTREMAWINNKMDQGVFLGDLKNGLRKSLDKSKETVMKKDNLTEKQYERKRNFLSNCYNIVCETIDNMDSIFGKLFEILSSRENH